MGAANLKVLVVWEPILPTDWSRPITPVLARISDRRAMQFWDKDHLIAKELRQHLGETHPSCCSSAGILWDIAAVYPQGAKWGAAPAFIDGPVVDAAPEARTQIADLAKTAKQPAAVNRIPLIPQDLR